MFLTRLGLRLHDGRHRRRHPGRPARRAPSGLRSSQGILDGVGDVAFCQLNAPGRRPPQAGQRHRRGLRPLRRGAGRAPSATRPTADATALMAVVEVDDRSAVDRRRRAARRPGAVPARRAARCTRTPSCRSRWSTPRRWPSCTCEWMDEPGPDRRAVLPDGRAAGAGSGRGRPSRACSATSCCARRSPREQGAAAGHGLAGELELLLTHGMLHLLGHDHAEPEEHAEMFGLQDRAARRLARTGLTACVDIRRWLLLVARGPAVVVWPASWSRPRPRSGGCRASRAEEMARERPGAADRPAAAGRARTGRATSTCCCSCTRSFAIGGHALVTFLCVGSERWEPLAGLFVAA